MSVDVGSVGWRMGSSDTILKNYHLRTILHKLVPIRHVVSEKKILKIFPIGSYVKTMSVDVGSLGWRMGSSDTILKGDHLRTIPSNFGPNRLSWLADGYVVSEKKIFKNFSHRVLC